MSDDLELESGLRARTESRVPRATREPAQIRRRDTSSPSDVGVVRPRVPDPTSPIVSYNSDDDDRDMLSNVEDISDPLEPTSRTRSSAYSGYESVDGVSKYLCAHI